ncbi:MAG: L-aspartate oxidase [Rhodospirillaceae bacterium]|jgi:L-aspartate oxidase|nr:L-aspartate oxidase [Rhodospirillaceae bacterium]
MLKIVDYDVLIIGSGASGLTVALQLTSKLQIAIFSKGELTESSTLYAQGGIAVALDEADSTELHIVDTLNAGDGLCDPSTVRFVVENAKKAIDKLIDYGVEFTRSEVLNNELSYHLTREGGHSHRRIIHADDATGFEVETKLVEKIRKMSNISIYENYIAIDLVCEKGRCVGVYVLDLNSGTVILFRANVVILATGGVSNVYLYSSNPDICTGDGIAMAWRAGCRVANLEFMQFHPTCLFHPMAKSFLISEAIRGEGGKLLLPNGERFMQRFDSREELAPRDVVARAIDHEMKRLKIEYVYLDISHRTSEFIISHFPMIYAKCLELGIDITCQPMSVVPAAHYTCGGIVVDKHGRTDLLGLYAIGEVSFTGLHGANRMASNSLLECLVYGAAVAADIMKNFPELSMNSNISISNENWTINSNKYKFSHKLNDLRRLMWDYVGIVRSNKWLEQAQHHVDVLNTEMLTYYKGSNIFYISSDFLELRNLILVADLIIRSAIARHESRGLHYNTDYPHIGNKILSKNTILFPKNY